MLKGNLALQKIKKQSPVSIW